MARFVRSLLFNLEDGKDVRRHRDHRSKKGRDKFFRDKTPSFLKYKNKKELLKQGVDKDSLRYLRKRYNIN